MSNSRHYVLSFTTLFCDKKGYVLMFNRHQRVKNTDNFPILFEPWSRYDALIMRDMKLGTKVKHATGVLYSDEPNFNAIFEGDSPVDLEKGSTYYLSDVYGELLKAGIESVEGDEIDRTADTVRFYSTMNEVLERVNTKLAKVASQPHGLGRVQLVDNTGEVPDKFESTGYTQLRHTVIDKLDVMDILGFANNPETIELLNLIKYGGYNQVIDLAEMLYKEGDTTSDSQARMLQIQYGDKVLDTVKANYLKTLLGSLVDVFEKGVKVEVVTEDAEESKLEVFTIVSYGGLDELDSYEKFDVGVVDTFSDVNNVAKGANILDSTASKYLSDTVEGSRVDGQSTAGVVREGGADHRTLEQSATHIIQYKDYSYLDTAVPIHEVVKEDTDGMELDGASSSRVVFGTEHKHETSELLYYSGDIFKGSDQSTRITYHNSDVSKLDPMLLRTIGEMSNLEGHSDSSIVYGDKLNEVHETITVVGGQVGLETTLAETFKESDELHTLFQAGLKHLEVEGIGEHSLGNTTKIADSVQEYTESKEWYVITDVLETNKADSVIKYGEDIKNEVKAILLQQDASITVLEDMGAPVTYINLEGLEEGSSYNLGAEYSLDELRKLSYGAIEEGLEKAVKDLVEYGTIVEFELVLNNSSRTEGEITYLMGTDGDSIKYGDFTNLVGTSTSSVGHYGEIDTQVTTEGNTIVYSDVVTQEVVKNTIYYSDLDNLSDFDIEPEMADNIVEQLAPVTIRYSDIVEVSNATHEGEDKEYDVHLSDVSLGQNNAGYDVELEESALARSEEILDLYITQQSLGGVEREYDLYITDTPTGYKDEPEYEVRFMGVSNSYMEEQEYDTHFTEVSLGGTEEKEYDTDIQATGLGTYVDLDLETSLEDSDIFTKVDLDYDVDLGGVTNSSMVEPDTEVSVENYDTAEYEQTIEDVFLDVGDLLERKEVEQEVSVQNISNAEFVDDTAEVVTEPISMADLMEGDNEVELSGVTSSEVQSTDNEVVLEVPENSLVDNLHEVTLEELDNVEVTNEEDVVLEVPDSSIILGDYKVEVTDVEEGQDNKVNEVVLEVPVDAVTEPDVEVVLEFTDEGATNRVDEVVLESVEDSELSGDSGEVVLEDTEFAEPTDTGAEVVLEVPDESTPSEYTNEVTLEYTDTAITEQESEVYLEETDTGVSEKDEEVVIEWVDGAITERDVDVSIEGTYTGIIDIEEEVSIEVPDFAEIDRENEVTIGDVDLAITDRTDEVVLEGTDSGITERNVDIELTPTETATIETFSDVVIEESDGFEKLRGKFMTIEEREEGEPYGSNFIEIFEDEGAEEGGSNFIDIFEGEGADSGGTTIIDIAEDEEVETYVGGNIDIFDDYEESYKYKDGGMVIDDGDDSEIIASTGMVISEDEQSDNVIPKNIVMEGAEDGLDVTVKDIGIELEEEGLRDKISDIGIEECEQGEREKIHDVGRRTGSEDDDEGIGKPPEEPPWHEPRDSKKIWLIMGKPYPAWSAWNPKKTR